MKLQLARQYYKSLVLFSRTAGETSSFTSEGMLSVEWLSQLQCDGEFFEVANRTSDWEADQSDSILISLDKAIQCQHSQGNLLQSNALVKFNVSTTNQWSTC